MNSAQRGMTLLVPVCLLLTLVTTAVWTYSKQLRHYAVSLQRQTASSSLIYSASESLGLAHHALGSSIQWQSALTLPQRDLITEQNTVRVRDASLTFFTLSATVTSQASEMQHTQTIGVVRHPLIVARPILPVTFSADVSPHSTIKLVAPLISMPTFWKQTPLDATEALQQHCDPVNGSHCQALSGAAAIFPDDIFRYVFGFKKQDFTAAALPASTTLANCSNLSTANSHVIWITGDCHVPAAETLGSEASPILLIVEDGHLSFAEGSSFTGLLVTLARTSNLEKDIIVHDTSTISGAAIIAQPLSSRSELRLAFSANVLRKLQNAQYTQHASFLYGSWHDF